MQFDAHGDRTLVRLAVSKAKQFGEVTSDFSGDTKLLVLRKEFDSPLEDEIKFKRIEEMKQIEANLMMFGPIAQAARRACRQLLTELLAQEIAQAIRLPGGSYELVGPSLSLKISARGCTLPRERMIELQAPVVVKEYDTRTGQFLRQMTSEKNALLGSEETVWPVRWVLELADAKVEETGQLMFHDTVGDLSLPASIAQRLGSDDPLTLALPQRASALLGSAPARFWRTSSGPWSGKSVTPACTSGRRSTRAWSLGLAVCR